jgi:predicted acetyltransferase
VKKKPFAFKDYSPLTDGEIDVVVEEKRPAGFRPGWVPSYELNICLHGKTEPIGHISLRIGNVKNIIMYGGHIGYRVDEAYRGHHYAARACRLVAQVARDYGFKELEITCNPDNYASRKTIEDIGGELIEIIDLPENNDMYLRGERQKCRYRWDIGETQS